MKVIIDIDKEKYDWLKENNPKADKNSFVGAIVHGTPLPKVHGRLMILSENRLKENQINLDWSCQKWISEVGLSNATVRIIKADTEIIEADAPKRRKGTPLEENDNGYNCEN